MDKIKYGASCLGVAAAVAIGILSHREDLAN
jgi:hypothetical protein